MKARGLLSLILVVFAFIVITSSIYYVDEREKAIVFQFGEIVRSRV